MLPTILLLFIFSCGGEEGLITPEQPQNNKFTLDQMDEILESMELPEDAQKPPKAPCEDDQECTTGVCIEVSNGKECADVCETDKDCPPPLKCAMASGKGICLQPMPRVCLPCKDDQDCLSPHSMIKLSCLENKGSWFCLPICQNSCLDNFDCSDNICIPKNVCQCNPLGTLLKAEGKCKKSNQFGQCFGLIRCEKDALTLCDAKTPSEETCNGEDDNCDGKTDEGFEDLDGDGIADCIDPDIDGDQVSNDKDNCPSSMNSDQIDTDGDGKGDKCDPDDDDDGILDYQDNCPKDANPEQADMDLDSEGDKCDLDIDGDNVPNEEDNCPTNPNPDQKNVDQDMFGDVCDNDIDGDMIENQQDNCDYLVNPDQIDTDGDNIGDACDPDDDNDFVPDEIDNCPKIKNHGQEDTNGNGLGDPCDPDADSDGVNNEEDNCPFVYNPDQIDKNNNKIGDACEDDWDQDLVPNDKDNCPWISNTDQKDQDNDKKGDACDCDIDNDGIQNNGSLCDITEYPDNCPFLPNPDQKDMDGDGLGDKCDDDIDGDNDPNDTDCEPENSEIGHGKQEICGGKDENCNGKLNEEDAVGCEDFYIDQDKDGFGGNQSKCLCYPSSVWTAKKAGDCDDSDKKTHPEAPELCDGKDNDCDGEVDEEDAEGCVFYYLDYDSDNFGVGSPRCLCYPDKENGFTATKDGDCADNDPSVNPFALEKCNEKDDDCDKVVDGIGSIGCVLYFPDNDGDGYGVSKQGQCLCKPFGFYTSFKDGDCDDAAKEINPSATEICDNKDNDCDGNTDEENAGGCGSFYKDMDKDGFGSFEVKCLCKPTAEFTATQSFDCDDNDYDIHPKAIEKCNNKDDDCDGVVDEGCQ